MQSSIVTWLLLFVASLSVTAERQADTPLHDGFEAAFIGAMWDTRKLPPGTTAMQSSVVRAGKQALKITLREGDQIPEERGSILERAEIEESKRLEAVEGWTYDYSFSLFLPRDFPIVATRLVIAQWKQRCAIENCMPDNPTLAIRYSSGELSVTHQTGPERRTLYQLKDDIRDRWMDFRFRIRFSKTADGSIDAWLDGKSILHYAGVNAYPESGGYENRFYFKVGLYRDRMSAPMSLYVDEYRKARVLDAAHPDRHQPSAAFAPEVPAAIDKQSAGLERRFSCRLDRRCDGQTPYVPCSSLPRCARPRRFDSRPS
jgi:hypothetical protein